MTESEQQTADSAFTYEIPAHESPTEGVVKAVSDVSGLDPVPDESSTPGAERTLDPLYTAVDPEALDSLFDRFGPDAARPVDVTFHYHGYEVTVRAEGSVSVDPLDAEATDGTEESLCVSQ